MNRVHISLTEIFPKSGHNYYGFHVCGIYLSTHPSRWKGRGLIYFPMNIHSDTGSKEYIQLDLYTTYLQPGYDTSIFHV